MLPNIDQLLPTAREIQKQSALAEAQKSEEEKCRKAAAEAKKKALIEEYRRKSISSGRIICSRVATRSPIRSLIFQAECRAISASP